MKFLTLLQYFSFWLILITSAFSCEPPTNTSPEIYNLSTLQEEDQNPQLEDLARKNTEENQGNGKIKHLQKGVEEEFPIISLFYPSLGGLIGVYGTLFLICSPGRNLSSPDMDLVRKIDHAATAGGIIGLGIGTTVTVYKLSKYLFNYWKRIRS